MILLQPPTYILLELHIISFSLIIYKPLTLIISSWTFNMQLGAGTLLFCLFQYAISFCTLSTLQESHKSQSRHMTKKSPDGHEDCRRQGA